MARIYKGRMNKVTIPASAKIFLMVVFRCFGRCADCLTLTLSDLADDTLQPNREFSKSFGLRTSA